MKIAVMAGSPKGEMSITLQYVRYIQKKIPEHKFNIIQIGNQIQHLEKDVAAFQTVLTEVRQADALLWCFPVYFLLIPCQMKRFIELVFERRAETVFAGKYATALTTSVHFHDHTAHNYIRAISEDLGMQAIPGFSADMEDLLKPAGRNACLAFIRDFLQIVTTQAPIAKAFAPVTGAMSEYRPAPLPDMPKTGRHRIVLLTDAKETDANLLRMTDTFARCLPNAMDIVNLHDLELQGGCLGCCQCGYNNICVYRDGMASLLKDKLAPADAIIFAGSIRDRYLSARWKMFFDRSFCNGHAPVMMGKQTALIISGALRQLPNLQQALEAGLETSRMHTAGIITDEDADTARTTALLKELATGLMRHVEEHTPAQSTFLSVGGHKIFRDLIYDLRFVFKADYRFFTRHNMFDYPQKNIRRRLESGCLSMLTAIPSFRAAFFRMAKSKMLEPYLKIVDRA